MTENFESVFSECLERLFRGQSIEDCLKSFPEHAEELEPLLQTAADARRAAQVPSRAEFKTKVRCQITSLLTETKSVPVRIPFSLRSVWATAVSAALIVIVVMSGTVVAASNSMPDATLYPVKLASERVWLTLTPSVMGKMELAVKLANRRVTEFIYELSRGDKVDTKRLELATQRLEDNLSIVERLAGVVDDKAGVEKPTSLRTQSDASLTPSVTAPKPAAAMEASPQKENGVKEGTAEATKSTAAAEPVAILDKDKARLRSALALYAVNNSEILREKMKTAPAEVKPALEKVITETIDSYDRAIKAIEESNKGPKK